MGHRSWTIEEKRRAVERMKSCGHDKLAAEYGVGRRQLYAWRAQLRRREALGLADTRRDQGRDWERENRELKEALARKVLEADFFRGALRRMEARRGSGSSGETASTGRSKGCRRKVA